MGHLVGTGTITNFPQNFLAAIFPDDCRICGAPLTRFEAFPVCPTCIGKVRPLEPEFLCERCGTPFLNEWALDEDGVCRLCLTERRGFDFCFSYGPYQAELRDLIHLFKYGRVASLAPRFGAWMLEALPGRFAADAVVPVPLHWWKRWNRGFNQAEILARQVAKSLALPMVQVLRRSRATGVQAGLSSKARRKNATISFSLPATANLAGKRVLLVDDVFTTGATATACARLLKRAGADSVGVLTLARVDRRAPAPFDSKNRMRGTHLEVGDMDNEEAESQ